MSDEQDERLPLASGHELHLSHDADGFDVWLNTGVADFDGIYIAEGATIEEAMVSAAQVLESVIEALCNRCEGKLSNDCQTESRSKS